MMYIESELCCEINEESALRMNLSMINSKRPFRCLGTVLKISDIELLPPKYHPLCIEFDALSQESKDKLYPAPTE